MFIRLMHGLGDIGQEVEYFFEKNEMLSDYSISAIFSASLIPLK